MNLFLTIYNYLFIFIIGITIGSFLNVCIYRIPKNISIIKGRSYCPNCNHTLTPFDLIPILSYLLLKKKCRYCNHTIPSRYFIIELLTGILFVCIFHIYKFSLITSLHLTFVSLMIVIAYIDYDTMYIYDYNHQLFLILGIFRYYLINDLPLTSHILGALCISISLLIVSKIFKDGIGLGDIKLIASAGFYLGISNTILSFIIGTLFACIIATYYLLKQTKSIKDAIPFGPYLCMGFIITLIFNNLTALLHFL